MATTPIYALRYQALGDAPDGPDLGAELAADVEAQLVLLNAKPIIDGAACTTQVDLTGTEVDITGATKTIVTTKTNARFIAIATFYMSAITGGTGVATGKLNVDTVNQAPQANFTGTTTLDRANVTLVCSGTLAAVGNHVFKLRGIQTAGGAFRVNTTATNFVVAVFER
jgi:hypothetical protein